MSFVLSIFSAIAVQKNTRDMRLAEEVAEKEKIAPGNKSPLPKHISTTVIS
jgi:hypothetical protein